MYLILVSMLCVAQPDGYAWMGHGAYINNDGDRHYWTRQKDINGNWLSSLPSFVEFSSGYQAGLGVLFNNGEIRYHYRPDDRCPKP